MDLDTRHLRYFVQLATDLNFTKAARAIPVAQQTLSESISQLERHLGVKLFERSPQRVEITAAGAVFLEHARDLLRRTDLAIGATRAAARREASTVLVGSPDWAGGIELFRAAIQAHRLEHGAATVVADPLPWISHVRAVIERRLDVGVTFIGGPDDLVSGLDAVPLLDDDSGWIFVAAGHPLTAAFDRDGVIDVTELAEFPILVIQPADHRGLHERLTGHLRATGVVPNLPANNDGPFASALAHALVSDAAVWVSASMALEPPPGLRALPVDGLAMPLQLVAIARAGDRNPQLQPFLHTLTALAEQRRRQR